MVTPRIALLLLCLACAVAPIRGQDFDLSDAFDDPPPTKTPTKKPAVPNKPPPADDGFDLGDALGGDTEHVTKKPVPRPNPGGGTGGEFGDADLFDAAGIDPNKPNNPNKPDDPLRTPDLGYTIRKMETVQQFFQLMKNSLSTLMEIMETTEKSIRDLLNYLKK